MSAVYLKLYKPMLQDSKY